MESTDSIETSYDNGNNADHGWQKVSYAKRQRKQKPVDANNVPNGNLAKGDNVFRSLEEQAADRRRRIVDAQSAADVDFGANGGSKRRSVETDHDDSGSDVEVATTKKVVKPKKPKMPKVTVAEAAAKIDAADLAVFLGEVSGSYADQPEIQLMRVADFFGRAFSGVTAAQFPWVKLFKEATVAKMADIPLSHISDAVYKTSVDWINQCSLDALGSFVLWSLDAILTDLASQLGGSKVSKKGVKQASSKSQVAIFVVLAMVLRRKPDALSSVLPILRENVKYNGQDKLPVIIWMMAQASQGDLAVGLYSWAHNLLPILGGRNCNPLSRDLILQLVERILSSPKAQTILVNGAVRKGERLIPPASFEILIRVTFPASSARVKATERFEAIYPTLKEVSVAGAPGSKAMKQVSQQIFNFAIKAAGEKTSELSKEAAGIIIWCLMENADCCKQWEKVYQENIEASVAVLQKLVQEWKEQSPKLTPNIPLKETIRGLRQKNETAIAGGADATHQSLYKEADKYCKVLSKKLSSGFSCVKTFSVVAIAAAVGAAYMVSSNDTDSWDLQKLSSSFRQISNGYF